MNAPLWHLDQYVATLDPAGIAGRVDVALPQRGWQGAPLSPTPSPLSNLLQVELAGENVAANVGLIEAYVRGPDLVATYEQPGQRPMRSQIYWRALSEQASDDRSVSWRGMELIVSVQTSLLDMDPRLSVSSVLPVEQVLGLDADNKKFKADYPSNCLLCRQAGHRWYLEMVHPQAVSRTKFSLLHQPWSPDAQTIELTKLRRELFAQRLEKGVILRARLQGLLMQGVDETKLRMAAKEQYKQFAASEPPLTV